MYPSPLCAVHRSRRRASAWDGQAEAARCSAAETSEPHARHGLRSRCARAEHQYTMVAQVPPTGHSPALLSHSQNHRRSVLTDQRARSVPAVTSSSGGTPAAPLRAAAVASAIRIAPASDTITTDSARSDDGKSPNHTGQHPKSVVPSAAESAIFRWEHRGWPAPHRLPLVSNLRRELRRNLRR